MTHTSQKSEASMNRPPVVAIMGHIDHGKSTLLDYIRSSNTVSKEAGGITQHIGAYEVSKEHNGDTHRITFLDTPGHEAFCSVRERGSKIADIAILIVSAEDGVKPQTKEALKCIQVANLPYIVAINKIDSPKSNIEQTKTSLMENEVYLEGFGGTVSYAEISAKTGAGINDLLDLIILTTEMEEFKASANTQGSGFVVEAHKDKTKGNTATLILKNGIAKKGQFIVTQNSFSPIRNILDQTGTQMDSVSFTTPFTVSGFNDLPVSGELFYVMENKKEAEEYLKTNLIPEKTVKHDEVAEHAIILPIIIKADVVGSKEAIEYELRKIQIKHVALRVIRSETGDITEADTKLATTNDRTIIIAFNVKIDSQARSLIERNDIRVKSFSIIYEIPKWVEEIAEIEKPHVEQETVVAEVKILRVFGNVKKLQIIGGKVRSGTIEKKLAFRIMRRNEEIGRGYFKGLQRQKQEVDSIPEPEEFGAAVDSKVDLVENDILEVVKMVQI